jgi:hypothetical protein
MPYRPEDIYPSPLTALRERKAHCFDGGLLGALALCRLGYPARIVDIIPYDDDDHILALFEVDGYLGAVAKSNFAGLRYREPVYRSLRELVMSYFDDFYNTNSVRSMRGYTRPMNLDHYHHLHWTWRDAGAAQVMKILAKRKWIPVLTQDQIERLTMLDQRCYQSGMVGTNPDGVYQAKLGS